MNLLNRYIILEFTKCFSLVLLSVLGIFIVIDYLGNMDEFIAAKITMWRAFQCVLLKVPFICTQAMPVILLLSILIVFGLMSKNNELINETPTAGIRLFVNSSVDPLAQPLIR